MKLYKIGLVFVTILTINIGCRTTYVPDPNAPRLFAPTVYCTTLDSNFFGKWVGPKQSGFEFYEDSTALEIGMYGEFLREWSVCGNKFCMVAIESGFRGCWRYDLNADTLTMYTLDTSIIMIKDKYWSKN